MNTYFNRIFWGMILIFLNVNIGSVDILPDIVGYIIIVMALSNLYETKNEEAFKKGQLYGWLMVLFAAFDMVVKLVGFNESAVGRSIIWSSLYGQGVAFVRVILLYYICKGIFNLGERYDNIDISTKAKERWYWVLGLQIGVAIVLAFTLNFKTAVLDTLLIIMAGIGFVLNILIIGLMRKAAYTFIESDINNL